MTKRILSFMLVFALLVTSVGLVTSKPIESQAAPTCYQQSASPWGSVYVGNWTIAASGCGILATVNAVNYLTGNFMDPVTIANWAHQNNYFNGSYGQGSVRGTLYPALSSTYGAQYGFKITNLTYGKVTNTTLINHLVNGGVVIVHVPNHFMALCGYNSSTGQYLVYDSSANATTRGTYAWGTWLTAAELNSRSASVIDWFCLVHPTGSTPITTYTAAASVASGSGTVHFGNNVTTAQVAPGTVVNFQVTPASGWTTTEILVGGTAWEIQNGGADCVYQFTMPHGNCGVVVKFAQTAYSTGVYKITSADGMNIRSAPVDGTVIGTVNTGTQITAIAITNTHWAKIVYQGQIGYVSVHTSYATKINTNTVPESDILFDTSNPVSWVSSSGTNATSVSLGTCPSGDTAMVVKTSSATNDPSFNMNFSVLGTLSASTYKYMIVTAKTSAANTNAKMYLCPGSITGATENCATSWQWTNDGLWHDYVINLSSLSTWTGNLNSIRFDYFDGDTASGATLYLRSIRFLTSAPSSPTVSTNKTTYAEGESITVSYSGLGSYTSPIQNAVPFVGLYKKGQKPGSVGSLYWAPTTSTSGSIAFPADASAGGGLTSAGLTAGEYMMWIAYDGSGSAISTNLNNVMFANSSSYCYFKIGTSTYTATASVTSGNGTVHFGGGATSAQVAQGGTVNYQVTPATGYKATKILVNGTAVTIQNGGADCVYSFTMPAQNTTVAVTFEKIPYTATTKVTSGSGSVHFGNNVTTGTFTMDTTVSYQVTPATGYTATKILVGGTAVTIQNGGGDYVYQFTMPAGDVTIEVTFTKSVYEPGVYEIASSDGVMSVRTAPTTGTVLEEISNGTRITALEIVDTHWAKIIYKGQYAYVSIHTSYAKYINELTIAESDMVFDSEEEVNWVINSNINETTVSLGTDDKGYKSMILKANKSDDPWVNMNFGLLGSLNASEYKYIIITAKTSATYSMAAKMYLSPGTITSATEDCTITWNWTNDGLWHDYILDLSGISSWKGILNGIRLDYFDGGAAAGDTLYVRSMRFLTSAPSSPKVTTDKTTYTVGENIVLSYSGLGSYGSVSENQAPFVGIYLKGEKPGAVDSQMWVATTGTSGSVTFPAGAAGGPMAGQNLPVGEYVAWIAYDASGPSDSSTVGNVMFGSTGTSYSFTITEATYTATASVSSGSGTVKFSNGSTSITSKSGASVTYTVTPSTGYKVSSIKVNGTAVTITNSGATATYTLTMPAKATTVAVTFAKIQYAVSVGTVSNGTVTLSKTGNVDYGTTITVTATPNTGYKLNQILVNGTAISATTFTVTKASTVTATFTKLTYTVSVGTVSNGKVTLSKTGTVDYGTTITVTATPNTGYELNQILVNGTAISGTTFTVKGASTVTATFTATTPTTSFVDKVGTGASSGSSAVFVEKGGNAADVVTELKVSLGATSVAITKDGEAVADTTKLGTGMVITADSKTYTVVIKGDVNGDGDVTQADATAVMADVLGTSKLSGAHKDAAFECSGKTSGNLSILDVMALLNAL